jgi:hypothetical protein
MLPAISPAVISHLAMPNRCPPLRDRRCELRNRVVRRLCAGGSRNRTIGPSSRTTARCDILGPRASLLVTSISDLRRVTELVRPFTREGLFGRAEELVWRRSYDSASGCRAPTITQEGLRDGSHDTSEARVTTAGKIPVDRSLSRTPRPPSAARQPAEAAEVSGVKMTLRDSGPERPKSARGTMSSNPVSSSRESATNCFATASHRLHGAASGRSP